jgi:hypothetical protein
VSLSNYVTARAEVCCRANKEPHRQSNVVTAGVAASGRVASSIRGGSKEAGPAPGKVGLSSHNSGTRRPRAILLAVLGSWFKGSVMGSLLLGATGRGNMSVNTRLWVSFHTDVTSSDLFALMSLANSHNGTKLGHLAFTLMPCLHQCHFALIAFRTKSVSYSCLRANLNFSNLAEIILNQDVVLTV